MFIGTNQLPYYADITNKIPIKTLYTFFTDNRGMKYVCTKETNLKQTSFDFHKQKEDIMKTFAF